jgi:Flp pilus assembly protein TadG
MKALRNLMIRLRQFRRGEDGVAAVEFALILVPMLLLYIGAMEASTLISMDRRVQSVSGAVGDLVARSDTTITAAMLTDYFRASGGIITPFPLAGLKQVVTQLQVSTDGKTAKVVWSRQYVNGIYGVGTDYPLNTLYPLRQAMIDVSKGKSVIVAEASYSYLPLYGIVIDKPIPLYRENFFLPRFGGTITVN